VAVENAQIQRQKKQDTKDETRPVPGSNLYQGDHANITPESDFWFAGDIVILIGFGGSQWDQAYDLAGN
jgi:hypothetical protein